MGRNAEAIQEGVAIALAAARLSVKNAILVGTISLDESFDPQHFVDAARAALIALADEQDEAAAAVSRARKAAWGRHTQPHGTHDYRDRDVRNLRRRAKQYSGVAKALRAKADDDAQLRELVERAREAAWHDVEVNLQGRLRVEAMRPEQDPDYESMREARMQALRLVDLQKLSAQARRKRTLAAAAEDAADAAS
ncbi:asparagine synthase [Microbacterium paludicola]|uniref:Asparagine synthase n=1 Tax=Microbacterium paludicola TaxID=300019 RepID=A0A4Y9FNI8_9MICO|nr:asparagine synthase [Microbacterium paludicola]MBF0817773.1 asparagine synthase [Microbacterium paludicola]TFU29889.1 asparagine synthase [Microbacterium paludicola]